MPEEAPARYRVKISATVDPDLLAEVDRFVRESPRYSRSRVIDDALHLWRRNELDRQMAAQYEAPLSDAEQDEMADWRRIRRAAATKALSKR